VNSFNDTVPDLSFLRLLAQPLTQLYVTGLRSGDLSPLERFAQSLDSLRIYSRVAAHDLTPLLRLRKLRWLALSIPEMNDLSFIGDLPPLDTLYLDALPADTDPSPLATQSSLKTFSLNNCPGITTLDGIPALVGLTSLELTRSSLTSGLQDLV